MALEQPFSKRNRNSSGAKEITVREDAPENLRYAVLQTAIDLKWTPTTLRAILCRVLRVPPDPNSQKEYPNGWGDPNVWEEVQALMYGCDWFKVYDIIEALHAQLAKNDQMSWGKTHAVQFTETLNDFFTEEGIGWQIGNGQVVARGTEAFETVVTEATSALEISQRPTAAGHLHDALEALSRRPKPNLSGAAYHAMGSLECVARDLTGDSKATLGEILKRHPGLLPRPLDTALSQVWGYASEVARHVREGREISREEAELLVGLSAT
jgi:hypothetical protein